MIRKEENSPVRSINDERNAQKKKGKTEKKMVRWSGTGSIGWHRVAYAVRALLLTYKT